MTTHQYTPDEIAAITRADKREEARLRHHPKGPSGPHCSGHLWDPCQSWRWKYVAALFLLAASPVLAHALAGTL